MPTDENADKANDLHTVPDADLVAELERRGYEVMRWDDVGDEWDE